MWEDLKSASVTLFSSCTGCTAPSSPGLLSGLRVRVLNNSSLPLHWFGGKGGRKEERRDRKKQKNKGWQEEERRQSPPAHPNLQPTFPKCSLKSALNQHLGSLGMGRGRNSLHQKSVVFALGRWLEITAKALLSSAEGHCVGRGYWENGVTAILSPPL